MPRDASSTREKIVAAAGRLFYGRGIRSVSMDDVAARAGVTKRTLYYHFRSKDDLITAYLAERDQPTLGYVTQWMDGTKGSLARKVALVFERMEQVAGHPKWKGCGFLRTAAELADTPGHPALKVGANHKKKLEAVFEKMIAAEGLSEPALRARQIMVLFDGAWSAILLHRDLAYARAAGAAAATLLR
ncbi:MAG: TetR/AcrR family transcriptional regulator [Pseudolabrys sp.]